MVRIVCHEYAVIGKITLGFEGIERVGAVEGYRRDRTGYFNRDCAGHGWCQRSGGP